MSTCMSARPTPPRRGRARDLCSLLLVVALLGLLAPAVAADPEPTRLVPGEVLRGTLPERAGAYQAFAIDVGPHAGRLEITVRGEEDVDAFVSRRGGERGQVVRAHGPSAREVLSLDRAGDPALADGTWVVYVVRGARAPEGRVGFEIRALVEWGAAPLTGTPRPSDEPLVDGEIDGDIVFEIDMDELERYYASYLVHVPEGTRSLVVTALGARRDIDLYLHHGEAVVGRSRDVDHRAAGVRFNEHLHVDEASDPPLQAGTYHLDVVRRSSEHDTGTVRVEVAFDAEAPVDIPALPGRPRHLPLDEVVEVAFQARDAKGERFVVDVPAGADALEVRVVEATRDIDLYLRHGRPVTGYDDHPAFDHGTWSTRVHDVVRVDGDSDPPLRPGRYHLDVVSHVGVDRPADVRIVASLGRTRPEHLPPLRLPSARVGASPLERAVRPAVYVTCDAGTGSGTCVSPRGHVITNSHVLTEDGETTTGEILVSFVDELGRPPRELFVARIVDHDEDLDLGLLELVEDVHGRPLPDDLDLPFAPLGDPEAVALGDRIWIAGYPGVGGPEGRVSLTVTRGVASGFVMEPSGLFAWIKTDARINGGNSGGMVLTEDLAYVAVPTMEWVDEGDEIGYCRPVSRLPPAWRERITAAGGSP